MIKFLFSLISFGIAFGFSILIMIYGWGLQPVSWSWIIFGSIGSSFIGALFQLADN